MSEEMALSDNVSSDDAKLNGDEAASASAVETEAPPTETPPEPEEPPAEDKSDENSVKEDLDETDSKQDLAEKLDVKVEQPDVKDEKSDIKDEILDSKDKTADIKDETPDIKDEKPTEQDIIKESDPAMPKDDLADQSNAGGDGQDMEVDNKADEKRGLKRRASAAFSDAGNDDFIGFEAADTNDLSGYSRVLDRLEAEVSAASKDFKPVRNVMATPSAPVRASKRPRQDTGVSDGSRPSSALSSRSDGDGALSTDTASSPLSRGNRRATTEMSSPLLRVPLERGWKRELVYRAALDAHSRRNADIYYYSPQGKKLRSTREVSEQLSGTGLTLENFSFFKEPLGVDDPEKEIIRDARLMRRGESPVAAGAGGAGGAGGAEAKRAPKPKAKACSPEPASNDPPAKIRVKSMGSRLSNSGPPPAAPAAATPTTKAKKPAPADNNNSAAWKKPRPPAVAPAPAPPSVAPPSVAPPATAPPAVAPSTPAPAQPPPPLQSRPVIHSSPEQDRQPARQIIQPCSLTCGRGVPSLACAACLCLYHPACIQHHGPVPQPFYCKNCRKSTSPPVEPPPLTHKSGVAPAAPGLPAPAPRRLPGPLPAPVPLPVPVPVPVPVPRAVRPEKRVLLRMKAASGGPEGERVWAVAQTGPPPPPPVAAGPGPGQAQAKLQARACAPAALPQSLVRLNGRRFIVVPHHKLPAPPADE